MPLPLVIPIISAIVSAASAVGGGLASAKKNRENQYLLNQEKADLDKELYQGVLDDAGSKAYLRSVNQNLRDSITGIENSAVSTGATHENTLAAKQAANEVMSNAVGNLLQQEEGKRQTLLNRKSNLNAQQAAINSQNAQNWQQISQGIANASSALGTAYMLGNDQLFKMDGIKPIENVVPTTNVAQVQNVTDPIMQSAKSGNWRLN